MPSSLALQALLKSAIARLNLGAPGAARVAGLSPAAQALFLAAAANRQAPAARHGGTSNTIVVLVATDADVEQLTSDLRFFLASIEGLSEAAANDAVLPFPSHEVDPYRGLAPHLGVMSARTRALHAAATGAARVIVASATAVLPRLSAPERLLENSLDLKPGGTCDPYRLASLLAGGGFSREDPVDQHGEFCVRGGVVDVFPAANAQPVRLDFIGDTIESVRQYDPATQRSTGEIDRVLIIPLREVFDAAGPASVPGRQAAGSGQQAADGSKQPAEGVDSQEALPGGVWRSGTRGGPASAPAEYDGAAARSRRSLGEGGSAPAERSEIPPGSAPDRPTRTELQFRVGETHSGPVHSLAPSPSLPRRERSGDPLAPSPQLPAPGDDDLSWAWEDDEQALSGEDDYDEEDEAPKNGRRRRKGRGREAAPVPVDLDTRYEMPAPRAHLLAPGADRSSSLFDYVRRPVLFVCESEEVRVRAAKSLEQLAGSYDDVVARGAEVPPPSDLFLPLDDLDVMLEAGTELTELGIGDQGSGIGDQGSGIGDRGTVSPASLHEPVSPDPRSAIRDPRSPSVQSFACQPAIELRGRVGDWVEEIKKARQAGETVLFVAATPGRAERTVEMLREYELVAVPVFVDAHRRDGVQARAEMAHAAAVLVATGHLSRGFRLPQAALQIFAETDVFEEERRPSERRRSTTGAFLSNFRDLKVGDFVVHVDHGIGVFVGLKQIPVDAYGGPTQEFLELRYAGEDKLFVPVERLDLLQKYTGVSRPPLDRLGGTTWERAKSRVKKAMRDMAEELLKLYAQRKAVPGHAFPSDTHWQEEFEEAFDYDLTDDQRVAVGDIKSDMESSSPMDRLLCGDVGYGKTEVAMRAAFKAVMDGKQVAFLAPTTILAFQHVKTLRQRFAGFPVRVDMVSRFRTKGEIKQTLDDLAAGKVDVIVGTHRLLSKDVKFHDLGLLVVDEEQRFGVAHKERIKQMRYKVDVLTMTATPIPRTLNMSLVGIRDMSVIETPPKDRLAIQTNVVRFDQQVIAKAVRNELARGGQVYFVHNRVQSIYAIGDLLQRLVPEAKIVVGHGQMSEDALERAMVDFMAKKYDILLATTIVENGLDIPNVNTIVINRADRYGLSQLYQLRGRVGRSDRPAYAYLLIPPGNTLSPVARKRLAAIREFSDLGSGFRVAALDLEIRGAGNLLGGEQSGHIEAIGFEMYTKLLEQTVRELKGEEIEDETRATVNLGIDLRIDERYVPDMNQRLMLYRRVAGARSNRELESVAEEITDRYGPMPEQVLNLVEYGRIRILADSLGIEKIDRQGPAVVFTFKGQGGPEPSRVVRLVREHPEVTLVPPASMKLDLKWKERVRRAPGVGWASGAPKPPSPGVGWASRPSEPSRPSGPPAPPKPRSGGGLASPKPRSGEGGTRPGFGSNTPSWWTARAKEEEVKPGFSKEAILRPEKEDPRAGDGILTRVGGVLSELAGKG